jgi:cyclohexanecarboxyl-CoA dehydrogenase
MEFSLTAEQQTLVDSARAYAQELAPGYQAREQAERIEDEVRQEMGAKGFIAPEISKELGGQGVSRLTSGMLLEQISTGDFNVGYLQVVGSLVGQILERNARPEVAAHWVPRITSGRGIVGIGLSEPHAGSDAGNPRLRAERDGPGKGAGWVLTGAKSLSLMGMANGAVVFARTSDEGRGRGITAFVVDLEQDGVTREPYSDMGTRAVARGAVHFDHVRVPAENVLGEVGKGFTSVMQGFDFSRALIGLQCVGTAQQTVDETWQYVSQREAFDRPISKFQGVSFPLSESETVLTAARLLCYQTLWLKDAGLPHTAEAAMCKWWAPKTAYDVINQCLLLHGQYGYRTELPIEQRMRDVLGLQIGDGTAQIMKLIIARQKLGREFAP